MDNLAERKNYNNRASGQVCYAWHNLTGSYKDQHYNSWKYVPTIISDRDSDLIGVRITRTQDAWEEGATQIVETTSKILGRWTMEASSEQGFIVKSRRGEEVTDWLNDNPLRFPKDGSPQLGEQGDDNC